MGDLIVILILIAIGSLAARKIIVDKRNGKSCPGCNACSVSAKAKSKI